jgi:LacI family transcriptional regulator
MVSALMSEKRQGASDGARRKPTLRQIAAHAGCSLATVSLALRDAPRIPESTRQRIQEIAQAVGYQADPREAAVQHRRRTRPSISSSTTLAFINFFRSVRFWRSEAAYQGFFMGAEQRAAEMGCKLEVFHPKAQGISGARLTKMLRARGIEGVILGSSPRASAHATLDWPQFTVVAQGLSLLRPQVSRVAGDYAYNIRLIMHHLRGWAINGSAITLGPLRICAATSSGRGGSWLINCACLARNAFPC